MIGLITKNNICRAALTEILSPLATENFNPQNTYDALILLDEPNIPLPTDCPLITIGFSKKGESYHLDTPIRPIDLVQKISSFLAHLELQKTFENADFIFQSPHRCLIIKETGTQISLTEKENDLLSSLAAAYPNPLPKETLLEQVWNYKPDTETHTLESHIYTLRQKIGPKADSLIQSTPTGYVLIGHLPE